MDVKNSPYAQINYPFCTYQFTNDFPRKSAYWFTCIFIKTIPIKTDGHKAK